MITNYDKFIDERLNEGLWHSLKNLFGKLLQGVSDQIKKPVDELNNKLSKTKDPKQVQAILANYLKVHNTTLQTQLKNTTNIPELKSVMVENLKAIYSSITAVSKTLGEDKFSFGELFAGSNAELIKLMDKDPRKFETKVSGYVDSLILTQSKQFGYKPEEVQEQLKMSPKDYKAKQEQKQITDATGGQTKESVTTSSSYDKLFEADAPTQTPQKPQTQAPQTPQAQAPADDKKQETKPAPTDDKKPAVDEKFTKLKDANKKWFDIAIYKKINDAVTKSAGEKPAGTIEDKLKNMTTTKHGADSVAKMVDAMSKADMNQLKQIRDILKLDKNSTPL